MNSYDKLISDTKEKYRISWEQSLQKFEEFCRIQDEDFKYAIKTGQFPLRFTIEIMLVTAKTRKLRAEYTLEIYPDLKMQEKIKIRNLFQEIQWGFIVCHDNFRIWKKHMRGEIQVDFWEVINW